MPETDTKKITALLGRNQPTGIRRNEYHLFGSDFRLHAAIRKRYHCHSPLQKKQEELFT